MPPGPSLPVGSEPGWEKKLVNEEDSAKMTLSLRGVAESSVILQSLRQSRDAWLFSNFVKFSSKTKRKQGAEISQHPHTIRQISKCDLVIGPHIFPDTSFFEVQYQPTPQNEPRVGSYYYPSVVATGQWSAQTPYGAAPYTPYNYHPRPPANASAPPASAPLITSLESSVEVTPALIAQVNNAASSNPTLQNLLQIAASGRASTDQLKTLGVLIQSLAAQPKPDITPASLDALQLPPSLSKGMVDILPTRPSSSTERQASAVAYPSASATPSSSYSSYGGLVTYPAPNSGVYPYRPLSTGTQQQQPVKPMDLVIEFRENTSDRWLFPREQLVCERVNMPGYLDGTCDIMLSVFVTVNKPKDSTVAANAEVDPKEGTACPATFRLIKASTSLWNIISKWAGDDAKSPDARKLFQQKVSEGAPRVYLQHQLPEGPILSQLQNIASPYTMKSIKPTSLTEGGKPKRAPRPRKSVTATADGSADINPPIPKRRKPAPTKPLPIIACICCGQTEVPLLYGGRYCRPCVDSGKATNANPEKVQEATPAQGQAEKSDNQSPVKQLNLSRPPMFIHSPLGAPDSSASTLQSAAGATEGQNTEQS